MDADLFPLTPVNMNMSDKAILDALDKEPWLLDNSIASRSQAFGGGVDFYDWTGGRNGGGGHKGWRNRATMREALIGLIETKGERPPFARGFVTDRFAQQYRKRLNPGPARSGEKP
jgi:hypothetical protein